MKPEEQPKPIIIEEKDFLKVVRLFNRVLEFEGSRGQQKTYMMNELSQLVGAKFWFWALGEHVTEDDRQKFIGVLNGGFEGERLARFFEVFEHKDSGKPAAHFYAVAQKSREQVTMLEHEIDPERKLAQLPEVLERWNLTGIGSTILSARYLDDRSVSMVGFYREQGDSPFTEMEKKIIHTILSEVVFLHRSGWPEEMAVPKGMYPRLLTVSNLLINGRSPQHVADLLGLARGTIDKYTHEIYTILGVQSQVELMRKFHVTREIRFREEE